MLVIDEADALMKIGKGYKNIVVIQILGYEEEMNQILKMIPKERQTALFSATLTKKVGDLIRLSLKNPLLIGTGNHECLTLLLEVSEKSSAATVKNLEQGYVLIEPEKKFLLLFTFLRKNLNKKIMIFFSSCNSVKVNLQM